jgi:hypothetical protein
MDQNYRQPAYYEHQAPSPAYAGEEDPKRHWKLYAVLVGVALIGILVGWGVSRLVFTGKFTGAYQSVFLTNGQVYFGKVVSGSNADPIVLQDVYYLQVTQQLQPAPDASASPQPVPQISLVKLGNELHGPTDEMRITRSQMLFIEDLKSDSQVVKAIQTAKK